MKPKKSAFVVRLIVTHSLVVFVDSLQDLDISNHRWEQWSLPLGDGEMEHTKMDDLRAPPSHLGNLHMKNIL